MTDPIAGIEARFHELIRQRASDLASALDLPVLPRGAESFPQRWFPVPGMHGGFAYTLHGPAGPVLVVESWSRVVSGSGQRHRITATECELVEEGFV